MYTRANKPSLLIGYAYDSAIVTCHKGKNETRKSMYREGKRETTRHDSFRRSATTHDQ